MTDMPVSVSRLRLGAAFYGALGLPTGLAAFAYMHGNGLALCISGALAALWMVYGRAVRNWHQAEMIAGVLARHIYQNRLGGKRPALPGPDGPTGGSAT